MVLLYQVSFGAQIHFHQFRCCCSKCTSDIELYGINMLKHQLGELTKGYSMEEVRENIKHKKLFGNRYISRDAYHKENTALCKSLNT